MKLLDYAKLLLDPYTLFNRLINMPILPSYNDLKQEFPLSPPQMDFIEKSRKTICQILDGKDPRLLLIVGPCSIHEKQSAKEFAISLKHLAEEVASHFFLVMRVYCEKSRTSSGWKGFLYDPHLDGSCDIRTGLAWTRELFLELADLKVPTATEFLDPTTAFYYDDLVTWGSVGARNSSAQTHRQLASHLSMPVGIKNEITGNISSALHGVKVATTPHTYIGLNPHNQLSIIKTEGNPYAHIVLRGGEEASNYEEHAVLSTLENLENLELPKRLLIDCSHANSQKCHEKQPHVFQSVMHQIWERHHPIKGLLMESHLSAGQQPFANSKDLKYGVSITDSCLDWYTTCKVIRGGVQCLKQKASPATYMVNSQ